MSNFFPISRFGNNPILGDFDSMIDAFFNEPLRRNTSTAMATVPAANILNTGEGYTIQLAVPGYSRDDFNISCSNGALTVGMATSNESTNTDTSSVIRQEYSYSGFTRSWSLPEGTAANSISARYDSGILSVYVPVEDANSGTVTISVD